MRLAARQPHHEEIVGHDAELGPRLTDMSKWPQFHVLALWLFGERYEADGWLEIRTRGPDLRWWESRCKVMRWNHQDLTGSVPISVRVELATGAELSGTAYVDQALHLWGWKRAEADLKIHGTEQGFKLRDKYD